MSLKDIADITETDENAIATTVKEQFDSAKERKNFYDEMEKLEIEETDEINKAKKNIAKALLHLKTDVQQFFQQDRNTAKSVTTGKELAAMAYGFDKLNKGDGNYDKIKNDTNFRTEVEANANAEEEVPVGSETVTEEDAKKIADELNFEDSSFTDLFDINKTDVKLSDDRKSFSLKITDKATPPAEVGTLTFNKDGEMVGADGKVLASQEIKVGEKKYTFTLTGKTITVVEKVPLTSGAVEMESDLVPNATAQTIATVGVESGKTLGSVTITVGSVAKTITPTSSQSDSGLTFSLTDEKLQVTGTATADVTVTITKTKMNGSNEKSITEDNTIILKKGVETPANPTYETKESITGLNTNIKHYEVKEGTTKIGELLTLPQSPKAKYIVEGSTEWEATGDRADLNTLSTSLNHKPYLVLAGGGTGTDNKPAGKSYINGVSYGNTETVGSAFVEMQADGILSVVEKSSISNYAGKTGFETKWIIKNGQNNTSGMTANNNLKYRYLVQFQDNSWGVFEFSSDATMTDNATQLLKIKNPNASPVKEALRIDAGDDAEKLVAKVDGSRETALNQSGAPESNVLAFY